MKISLSPIGNATDEFKKLYKKFPQVVKDEMMDVAKDIKSEFNKTTSTWKHKPVFEIRDETTRNDFIIDISTFSDIYSWVDEGTEPHIIRPVNASVLAFQSSIAKTVPRVIASNAGGRFGATIFSREVHHPGTKPREFTQQITSVTDRTYFDRIEKALQRWADQ
jgi:hypothetical protein